MKPLSKTVCLKILITALTYDSIILGLGIYLRERKRDVHKQLALKCF